MRKYERVVGNGSDRTRPNIVDDIIRQAPVYAVRHALGCWFLHTQNNWYTIQSYEAIAVAAEST